MLNKRILLKIALNSLLGLVLIFAWSRFVNLNEVADTLKKVDSRYAFLFFLLFVASGFIRALRLKLLLKQHEVPLKDLTMLHFLAQFLSFLIPIRAGEIAKSVYLSSQYQLPLSKTVVWVFIDRFLDFWMAILVIGLLLPFVNLSLPGKFVEIIFTLLVIFSLTLLLGIKSEPLIKKTAKFVSKFLIVERVKIWFVSVTHNVAEGFEVLRRPPQEFAALTFLTIAALTADAVVWLVLFKAFGFDLGFLRGLWADALTALTFLVPAAPGYVGSAEAAGAAIFSGILGIPINLTSAVLVFFHILTLLAILILGITSLYFLKFDLSIVWKKIKGN